MEFSKDDKVAMLLMAQRMIDEGRFVGICAAIYEAHYVFTGKENGISIKKILTIFPELTKHRPDDKKDDEFWFTRVKPESIQIRHSVINTMIAEIEHA